MFIILANNIESRILIFVAVILSNPTHISKIKFVQSIAACAVAGGLVLGHFPAFMSVGAILLCACGILLNTSKDWRNTIFIAFALFWLWQLISGFWCDDISGWQAEVTRKISFILIPAGLLVCTARLVKSILITFCLAVLLVAILSVGNYFIHYDEVNLQITKSIGMPIISQLSHIYFSILNGLAALLCIHLWNLSNRKNIFWIGASIILIICLHILSSRTGLVAFYITSFLLLIQLVIVKKRWKMALLTGITALLLPVAGYYTTTSFRNRIDNTVEDMDHYFNGKYLNYYSISMRFEAWKICGYIFEEHPIIGVGVSDLPNAMTKEYDTKKIQNEVRIYEAHNQYIEQLADLGIIGFLTLIFILYTIVKGRGSSFWVVSVLGMFATAFLFESVLESHNGIAAFALFGTLVAASKKL